MFLKKSRFYFCSIYKKEVRNCYTFLYRFPWKKSFVLLNFNYHFVHIAVKFDELYHSHSWTWITPSLSHTTNLSFRGLAVLTTSEKVNLQRQSLFSPLDRSPIELVWQVAGRGSQFFSIKYYIYVK